MTTTCTSFGDIARVVITTGIALTVAGCGTTAPPAGSPSAHASCGHGAGFELSLATDTGGERTPVAAATHFAADGGIESLPRRGWHVVDRNKDGVTLRSGSSTVHAAQGSDGTWQVDSGAHCT
jgi:hypothetical protein